MKTFQAAGVKYFVQILMILWVLVVHIAFAHSLLVEKHLTLKQIINSIVSHCNK